VSHRAIWRTDRYVKALGGCGRVAPG